MKKTLIGIILVVVIVAGALFAVSPVRPVDWKPDANVGLNNMFLKNDALRAARVFNTNVLLGPEDIYISDEGIAYTGLANGNVVSFPVNSPTNSRIIANTGGRPLGIKLDAQGNIIVSDAVKGLLSISPDGEISVLVNAVNGMALRFVDHHVIAQNGDIYFSNASNRYGITNYMYDFIEATATGTIYRYSPTTGRTELLMSGLFFANGVALGPEDAYLLVAETGRSRIMKYHLSGPQKGQSTVFANNLPGMPDNISFNGGDTFWVGMIALRDWRVEGLSAFPILRRVMGALPLEWLAPKEGYGFLLGFDTHGNVVANYQAGDTYNAITSVQEHNNTLYIGSLLSNGVAVLPLQ
jgi:sugar lactone lactonase YvrE